MDVTAEERGVAPQCRWTAVAGTALPHFAEAGHDGAHVDNDADSGRVRHFGCSSDQPRPVEVARVATHHRSRNAYQLLRPIDAEELGLGELFEPDTSAFTAEARLLHSAERS